MDFQSIIKSTYLKQKLQKNPFKNFFIAIIKALGKYKNCQIKKSTSYRNLIVLNTRNLSSWFHGQTSLKVITLLILIPGVKLLLIGLRNALIDMYFLTLQYMKWEGHKVFSLYCWQSGLKRNFLDDLGLPFKQ